MDRSAGSNGAAASIMAHDITATKLLFFKSMIASTGLISRGLRRIRPQTVQAPRQVECLYCAIENTTQTLLKSTAEHFVN